MELGKGKGSVHPWRQQIWGQGGDGVSRCPTASWVSEGVPWEQGLWLRNLKGCQRGAETAEIPNIGCFL